MFLGAELSWWGIPIQPRNHLGLLLHDFVKYPAHWELIDSKQLTIAEVILKGQTGERAKTVIALIQ